VAPVSWTLRRARLQREVARGCRQEIVLRRTTPCLWPSTVCQNALTIGGPESNSSALDTSDTDTDTENSPVQECRASDEILIDACYGDRSSSMSAGLGSVTPI
jgi:hypothetical protein